MKKVRKVRKVSKIRKIRKKKVYVPRTKNDIGTSKAECNFGLFLQRLGIEVETQFQIAYKYYDFKVKDKNIFIEFHGTYYHCQPKFYPNGPINNIQRKNVKNDKYKNTLAESNGFRIIYCWEDDFNNHKDVIIEQLKSTGLLGSSREILYPLSID